MELIPTEPAAVIDVYTFEQQVKVATSLGVAGRKKCTTNKIRVLVGNRRFRRA